MRPHLSTVGPHGALLLVAGATSGMAATFNAPLASVLLAVELLLFGWRPRSRVTTSCDCVDSSRNTA